MRQLLIVCLTLVALMSGTTSTAQQPARLALLIGNQAYNEKVGPLKNPHKDIALVGKALAAVGFTTHNPIMDGTRDDMLYAVHELGARLRSAGRGAVGFVYYSGHGIAVGRENVLIPANATDTTDATLNVRGVRLADILDILKREAPDAVHFVVLDACRNNIRGMRGTKGFIPVTDQHSGVVIAFATAAGETASDEGADSGPYAAALAAEIVKPGLNDQQVFNAVRTRVVTQTRTQTPWTHDGLIGDRVVFKAGAQAEIRPPSTPTFEQQAELAFWASVKDSKDPVVLQLYLDRYPTGAFADLAKLTIAHARREAEVRQADAAKQAADAQRLAAEQKAREAQAAKQQAELREALEEARQAREAQKAAERDRLAAEKAAEEARRAAEALKTQGEKQVAVATPPPTSKPAAPQPTPQPTANVTPTPQLPAAIAPVDAPVSFKLGRSAKLKLQDSFPSKYPITRDALNDVSRTVKDLSGGTLEFDVFASGAIVHPFQALDGVHSGVLDAAWTSPLYYYGKTTVAVLYAGAVAGGLDPPSFVRWIEAEGAALMNATLSDGLKMKVRSIPCGIVGSGGDWYKKPIRNVSDFKGLKFRTVGFAADVGQKMGMSVMQLPGGEIVPAIERGLLDASDSLTPLTAAALGLPDVSKFLHYPGWTHPAYLLELLINGTKWEALEKVAQRGIVAICRQNLRTYLNKISEYERQGLEEVRKQGVTVHTYPPSVLESVKASAKEQLQVRAQDPEFAKVLASYNKYR